MKIKAVLLILLTLLTSLTPMIHAESSNVLGYQWDFYGQHFSLSIFINGTSKPEITHEGNVWSIRMSIPYSDYSFYHRYPAGYRIGDNYTYLAYFLTPNDTYMKELASMLDSIARENGWNRLTEANFILSFVQNVPYVSDFKSTGFLDYYKFPIETLLERGGDCEDKSLLLATIMYILGYDVVLFVMKVIYGGVYGHVAVGLNVRDPSGPFRVYLRDYFVYKETRYYYMESTGSNTMLLDGGSIKYVHYWAGISPSEAGAKIENLTVVPLNNRHYDGYFPKYGYVKEVREHSGFEWYFLYASLLALSFLTLFAYALRKEKKRCPVCNYELEPDFEYCPNCGYWLRK